jgi:hypothetical protein
MPAGKQAGPMILVSIKDAGKSNKKVSPALRQAASARVPRIILPKKFQIIAFLQNPAL